MPEREDGPLRVLFVCVANSCRSQMAQSIARRLEPSGRFEFESAGAFPAYGIDSGAREFLSKNGYDFSGQRPKGLEDVGPLGDFDAVITLCPEASVTLPPVPRTTRLLQWNLEDPTGFAGAARESAYRKMHDRLVDRLKELLGSQRQNSPGRGDALPE